MIAKQNMTQRRRGRHISDEVVRQRCDDLNLLFVRTYIENQKTHVVFRCPQHLNKGDLTAAWTHFRTAQHGCPYCYGKCESTDDFKKKLENINPAVKVVGDYVSSKLPIDVECLICGHHWSPVARSLTTGQGCPICAKSIRADKRRKSHDQFVADLSKVAPHICVDGEYVGVHQPIKCSCKIHSCTWSSYPCNLLNLSAGCPECAIERFNNQPSKGERLIATWLRDNDIPFAQEVTMDGCVYQRPLRFDFYLPTLNMAIEFDGEQHFSETIWNKREGSSSLAVIQERDAVKTKYCAEHNISLLRIPYTKINHIDSILNENIIGDMQSL